MVTNLVILTREDRKNWYKLRELLEGNSLDTAILVDSLKNNGLNNIHIKHFIVNYHSKRFGSNYEQIIFYTKKDGFEETIWNFKIKGRNDKLPRELPTSSTEKNLEVLKKIVGSFV